MLRPTSLELEEDRVVITWSDGLTTRHRMDLLRKGCPCATCRTERKKLERPGPVLRVLTDAPSVTEVRILEFSPVGRYALNFLFNDGHNAGIYTYDFLRENALPD